MPRVPVAEAPDTRVGSANLPEVRVNPGPNVAAEQAQRTGAAVTRAGDLMVQAANQMQDRENADAIFKAETDIKNAYLEFQTTARERRGEQAKGLTGEAGQWWDKQAGDIANKLPNDRTKALFGQAASRMREQSMQSMSSFEAGERRRSLEQSTEASIAGSINLAASQVGTPTEREAVVGARTDVLKRLGVLRQLNGWDDNLYAAKQSQELTNLHMQVLQNKVDRDPAGARDYFELNKAEINGGQHNTIDKMLRVGAVKQTAQAAADELMASGVSEADGLKTIREKLSGDEEAAATQEFKVRVQEQAQQRERAQRNAADEAWGIFARKGLGAIPAALRAQLDGRDLISLERAARERVGGEKEPKTDSEVYYGLRVMMRDDPEAFANQDLRRYFPSLSRGDREEFIRLQTKPEDVRDAVTLDAQLSDTHDSLGWKSTDREKKGTLDRRVREEVFAEQKRVGKKLGQEDRQRIIDRMVIQGEVKGGGLFGLVDPDRRYFEVQGTDDAARFVPEVPKDERKKIEDALRRAGRKIDDAIVTQLYKQKAGLR